MTKKAVIVAMVFQCYMVGDGDGKPLAINAIARLLTKMGIQHAAIRLLMLRRSRKEVYGPMA